MRVEFTPPESSCTFEIATPRTPATALSRSIVRSYGDGVFVAYAAARGMSALLFGVAPDDPPTFAAGVCVALLMAFAGSLLPALRALRVSPASVLRPE